jgi:arabinose-5-phosphate isomerase
MTKGTGTETSLELARRVLRTEANAILGLMDRLGESFERAVQLLYECHGRVIVTGMGKSGIICRKIAATLSSTGTPAFFLHPAEAIHGDLGVIRNDDVVLALSHSGETEELVRLLEGIRRVGARLIALTGNPESVLGQAADITLDGSIAEEACPWNLVPTASTTAALALGDALAMALVVRKGFSEEHFASLHPGGKLGKRLMRIGQLMHTGASMPAVRPDTPMRDVIQEMTSKRLGMTCVVDERGVLLGVVTDGDLRRHWSLDTIRDGAAADVMTRTPVTAAPDLLAVEALRIMEERKITSVVVVGAGGIVEGVLQIHDLWRTQMF